MFKKSLLVVAVLFAAVGFSTRVSAQGPPQKVDICHSTSAVANPYVSQSPNVDNNGDLVGGHLNDTGPIFDPAVHENSDKWGDIIPPYNSFAGLNWTEHGQLIWNNECVWVPAPVDEEEEEEEEEEENGQVLGDTTQVDAPTGGVDAGFGAVSLATSSLLGLGGSVGALGYGIRRLNKDV